MASRRWLAPEVVQSSSMDCGPATLKCLLEGHRIPMSYGRLREACQTDVDGTSIDAMETVAKQLGLDAEQILVPAEHLLLAEGESLPAIVVFRLASGMTHFVVVWGERFGRVQVMDPEHGRRFLTRERFFDAIYEHEMEVPAAAWREWASSPEARACFERRLRDLGFSRGDAAARVARADSDASYRSFAALDAAARAVTALRDAGATRGARARALFDDLIEETDAIPERFWSVRTAGKGGQTPCPETDMVSVPLSSQETLLASGAVLVRTRGRRAGDDGDASTGSGLSPELRAALEEPPSRPGAELLRRLRDDGSFTLASLGAALFGASAAVVLEAVLFRSLLDVAPYLSVSGQRLGALGAVVTFVLLVLALDFGILRGNLRLGRKLEARLRLAFQAKIPRLADRYFGSRLTSDMAERQHSLHALRLFTPMGGMLLGASFELLLTAAGIAWLQPSAAPLAAVAAVLSLVVPFAGLPQLLERDLRVRSHLAGLSRFYLDALLGLVPIRLHGADRALRAEHESLLTEWVRARLKLQRFVVGVEGVQFVIGFGLASWLLLAHLDRGGAIGSVLLLTYWALNLPVLGLEVAELARRYPEHRNIMLRLQEPLAAPEEPLSDGDGDADGGRAPATEAGAASIDLSGVEVRVGGHPILEDVDLSIPAGAHVAVVGASGAGKSTLLGLLLGWYRPSRGAIRVDGQPLDAERLRRLRSKTAWVDPAVQIWNESFLDNLRYGGAELSDGMLSEVIRLADLKAVLELLPDGHQTSLGEGGGLVSGGEGQRVRLARGLLKQEARLVLLDEPFRGLDRTTRRELLDRARRYWKDATVLCVTHDLAETRSFDFVAVVDEGRVAAWGAPAELDAEGSRYRELLEAHERAERLFRDPDWRRVHLEAGRLEVEREPAP